jgi:hypothetical protein
MSHGGQPSRGLIPQRGDAVSTRRTPSEDVLRASRRGGPRPPTYRGSGLPLDDRYPPREESWAAMSAKIRGRLTELAGDVIEWFASSDPFSSENRPRAVVLGTLAFCVAEPRIDATGRPVYELNRYEFVPGSHKTMPVKHRPGGAAVATKVAPQTEGSLPPPSGRPSGWLGLSSRELGQLGNLPPKAQELLQAPFSAKDPVQRCEYWYSGRPNRLDTYMLVLAGRHFVTAAVGTQQVPIGHSVANAHWDLTCHRLAVDRVVGS